MISAAITTQSPPLTLITPAVSFQTRKPTSTCPSAGGRCPSNALSVFQSIPHFPSTPSPSPTDGGTPALLDSSSIPDFCCERCKTPGCEPGPRTPCRLVILLVLTTFLFFPPSIPDYCMSIIGRTPPRTLFLSGGPAAFALGWCCKWLQQTVKGAKPRLTF